jgi:hypothetical protein
MAISTAQEVSALDTWSPPEFVSTPPPTDAPPNGAAAATLLACGIGCVFFGLLVLLNDASPWLHEKLTFSKAVGPLSGKSTVGVAGWLAVWCGLHFRLRNRRVAMAPVVRATRILVVVAFVLTFPPFYLLFAAE